MDFLLLDFDLFSRKLISLIHPEIRSMRAQIFIAFQKSNDEAFHELAGPITDEQDRRLAAIRDAEQEALDVICRTETASLDEIADRAEILAASMEDDRFDFDVWRALARRIADDLRVRPAAS